MTDQQRGGLDVILLWVVAWPCGMGIVFGFDGWLFCTVSMVGMLILGVLSCKVIELFNKRNKRCLRQQNITH